MDKIMVDLMAVELAMKLVDRSALPTEQQWVGLKVQK